jgi:glucosylceramidase
MRIFQAISPFFPRIAASSVLLLGALALPAYASNPKVTQWLTTPDRTSLLAKQPGQLRFKDASGAGPTIEVDDAKTFQTMDGFGFALTGGSAELIMRMTPKARTSLLHELFGVKGNAIGVSYLRVSIGSSDMNDHVFTYDDLAQGEKDLTLEHFNLGPDLKDVVPVLKEILAINPRISILASPWSAPSWMKTNDDPKGGSLKPEYYEVYSRYLVKYIEAMRTQGITIAAITIQNEPLNPKNTPSMSMSSEEQEQFIQQAFGPQLRKSNLATKIVLYDHNCDKPQYAISILKDPEASQYVDGSGFHLYGGTIDAMTTVHDAAPQKNLYFTEQMIIDQKSDPTLQIAKPVSRVVIGATENWSRNVLLWNLAADPQFGPHTSNGGCPVCEGAITLDGDKVTRNLAFYTVGQASKFIPVGSTRIASSPASAEIPPHVAFRTPAGKHVLIVANPGAEAKTFNIRFEGKDISTSLGANAAATYTW